MSRRKLEELELPDRAENRQGELELQVRLPKKVAEAVAADPEGATQHLEGEARRMLDELCTSWESEAWPPMAGYWGVTDHATGTLRERWWFTGAHWELPDVPGEARQMVGIAAFKASYAWRGLKEIPPEGYPIPPYNAMMFSWRFPDIAAEAMVAPIGSKIVLPIPFYGASGRRKLEA